VTRFIREQNADFHAYAVEPTDSPVIGGGEPGPHKIQGIGAGFIPGNLDTSLLNGVITVSNEEAFEWGRRVAKEEGIFGGISTGANVCATAKAIEKFKLQGKRIVTIGCSFGERYLSTPLYEGLAK
jgi:cysteine synthase A